MQGLSCGSKEIVELDYREMDKQNGGCPASLALAVERRG